MHIFLKILMCVLLPESVRLNNFITVVDFKS